MQTTKRIGRLFPIIASTVLIAACDQPPNSTQQAAQTDLAAEQLLERCISQARANGYRSGQCAYNFIRVCVNTQSREEMTSVLRADNALGISSGKLCPNSPDTYSAAFDKF